MLDAALEYIAAGISIIPIDTNKRPLWQLLPKNAKGKATWEPFQHRIADEETVRAWFADGKAGIAAVCGAVSGGLLAIDHDVTRLYPAWRERAGELADGLVIQRTPSGGNHALLRCTDPGRNDKLAWAPSETEETGREIAIETRGEAGYVALAPTPGYEITEGDLTAIPFVSQARADALLAAARKLDEAPKTRQEIEAAAKRNEAPRVKLNGQAGVIDAYNEAVTIEQALDDRGYKKRGKRYIRPDGTHGSITVKDGQSFHHNTNDPLCDGYWHDAFDVFCTLDHAGDYTKAVKAAAEQLGLKLESHGTSGTKVNGRVRFSVGNGTRPAPHDDEQPHGRRYLTEDEIDHLQPPTWLVKDVVPAGEVTMIIGAGDTGKTFITLDMVKRVAEHYRVMYIAAEDASGIKIRKRAWELHHHLAPSGNFLMWDGVLPLFEAGEVQGFIDEVRELGLRMIVVDTLSQSIAGADENSSKDMTLVMQHCQWIARETGAAVVIIHHTTKSGDVYRGSSTILNNTYGLLQVSRDDDLIKFECGRIKNSKPFAPRYFKLVEVATDIADEAGQPLTSCVIAPADRVISGDTLTRNQIKMLESLLLMTDAQGGAATTELQSATGFVGNSFYHALKRLRNLGLVDKGDKRTDPLYVTHAGRERLARESNDPEYQEPGGRSFTAAPPFEVNTRLGHLLPRAHGSNDGSNDLLPSGHGSNGGSNTPENTPAEEASYHAPTTDADNRKALESPTTTTTKLLPSTDGSNGSLTTTTLSPLGRVVGSNGGSKEAKQPPGGAVMVVNRYLAKAQTGDPASLVKARDYMAANAGYDWTKFIEEAERIAEQLRAEVPTCSPTPSP